LPLAIAEDATPGTNPSQQLKGTVVRNGKPVANAEVRLVYQAPREKGEKSTKQSKQQILATTVSGSDGQFTFSRIDPGNYIVMAGIRRSQARGREIINIKPGQTATIQIDLATATAKPPTTAPAPVKKKKKA
jgi:hypothetical protein